MLKLYEIYFYRKQGGIRLNGWLIHNGAVVTDSFKKLHELYEKTAKKKNINLQKIKNNEIYSIIENSKLKLKSKIKLIEPDFILFMDKDILLAKQLEKLGYKVFNSTEAIANCDDKEKTFQILGGSGIKLPKTVFSPLVFKGTYEEDDSFIDLIEEELEYPIVVKEAKGSFGWQVYLVKDRCELKKKRKELLYIPHLYQEFIKSSFGRDIRLNVVGDKVVASIMRISENDFRANVSNCNKIINYEASYEYEDVAIKATQLLGLDFAGVDILIGENNEPILCEVNSNAHIIGSLKYTGINVADYIFDKILKKIGE